MTGRQVLAAVVAILIATAVLPPGAAWLVNHRRVDRAARDVASLASRLVPQLSALTAAADGAGMLCDEGRVPEARDPRTRMWGLASRGRLSVVSSVPAAADPWGNCYLVRVAGESAGSTLVVLSAGPNGVIETAFEPGSPAAGDDIVVRRQR